MNSRSTPRTRNLNPSQLMTTDRPWQVGGTTGLQLDTAEWLVFPKALELLEALGLVKMAVSAMKKTIKTIEDLE